jgi:hypothetical protein
MFETLIVSFLVIVAAGGLLGLGQWFGRPPISGKCGPADAACCLRSECATTCPRRGRK